MAICRLRRRKSSEVIKRWTKIASFSNSTVGLYSLDKKLEDAPALAVEGGKLCWIDGTHL
jgi:hypothetical protein